MELLGKKISGKYLLFCLSFLPILCVNAEEPVRVQAVPQVQAVNLSPVESSANVVQLQPQQQQVIKVQTVPTVKTPQPTQTPQTPQAVQTVQTVQPQQKVTTQTQQMVQPVSKTAQQTVQAPKTVPTNSQITPSNVSFDTCTKMFAINAENLFVLTLGAVEANGFTIKELQSKGGYITFEVQGKEFLATIAEVDAKNAMLKVNPTNGVYHFAPGIVSKIFEYIDYKLAKN